jgi:hypothetical protein
MENINNNNNKKDNSFLKDSILNFSLKNSTDDFK